jgi:hypothetical protein
MAHKNIPHTEKQKGLNDSQNIPHTQKHKGLDDSQKHSANTQKNKDYIQLHKIRQCCKQFSWPNSRQYCNSVQNFVLTQKSNYKC